ncbi:sodium-dependent nutrient amino acid transporter 1 isoform X1 [Manduca sexta]|nr:sodium-dependent nutrient amino acid transporter 1 isoform X1 [Manduca sexta]
MSLFMDRKDHSIDSHFRWNSIKKFIYLACTYSTCLYNFDIFSKVCETVRIFDFVLCEVTIGMPYMCMDSFIKQYTRKLDCNKFMNPLLRGIAYGLLLQTALWTLIHAGYLADSIRYLVASLQEEPSWTRCYKTVDNNSSCIPASDLILRCRQSIITKFDSTSAHFNYLKSFMYLDRSILATRFFVIALVWIFNFFFATVQDDTLIKIFKVSFICRVFSTLIAIFFILISTKYYAVTAFVEILDISAPHSYTVSMDHIVYTYGIGFLGLYDFATMSPYTMIDNAVVIFAILFTAIAFIRSWIVRILYMVLTNCVEVEISVTPHYLLFAILPLSTEFLYAHKLYIFYIYSNVMVATMAYLAMLTLTMSKLLHNEFRSIKNIYIVGILCFLGFSLSVPIVVSMTTIGRVKGLIYGLNVVVLYLGGFKVAIVMWVYGVQRFSTDIHFWLGFKPTKFWAICWMLLPIVLLIFFINRVYSITQMTDLKQILVATVWIVFSVITVAIFHIKTIARYIVRNNLVAAFKSSIKYGPPDPEDRKRRRNYNETVRLRQCKHNCNILDDVMECNHMPIMFKSRSTLSKSSSSLSLTNIYETGTKSKIKSTSGVFEVDSHH